MTDGLRRAVSLMREDRYRGHLVLYPAIQPRSVISHFDVHHTE